MRPELLMQKSSEIIILNISIVNIFSFLWTRALFKSSTYIDILEFLSVTSPLCFTNLICIVYNWQSKHN